MSFWCWSVHCGLSAFTEPLREAHREMLLPDT
jgi:hypothetical protein